MARIRSIHPPIFSDEAFVSCSVTARLLVIGLWTEADDKGVFEWKPLSLKMRIFPADAFDIDMMSGWLGELTGANIVHAFEAEGKNYGAIRNFRKYQRPQKPNDVHPLPESLRAYVALSATTTIPVLERSRTSTRKPKQMEDGGGKRKDVNTSGHIHEQDSQEDTYAGELNPSGYDGVTGEVYDNWEDHDEVTR
ncbi:hypothetical protein RMR10_012025 [Agrobacterium rosae]|uniref:hypothetical protein n=1 Tax=Agrobacterium rosae TaxID=1972867 RepID=UPI002A0F4571|nr:hypothetical protein [Agrobacterium rosae]MDX8313355.1 hypothetical protein [Agrobacterium rosae]